MKSGRLECTEKPDISVLAFIVIVEAIICKKACAKLDINPKSAMQNLQQTF